MLKHSRTPITVTCCFVLSIFASSHQPTRAQIRNPLRTTIGRDTIEIDHGKVIDNIKKNNKAYVDPRNDNAWKTLQWAWIIWWEANAHRYLKPIEKQNNKPEEQALAGYSIAETALLKALKEKKNPKVLAQTIWALGRMKSTAATSEIVKFLKHPNEIVRRNSWLSLGLIEDDLAKQTINDVLKKPTFISEDEDATAWIVAIGLMQKADPKLLKVMFPIIMQENARRAQRMMPSLRKLYRNEATIQARMAMWTLRMHNPRGIQIFAQRLLNFTTDPILYDEAIQTIGAHPSEKVLLKLFNPIYHMRLKNALIMPRAFSIDAFTRNGHESKRGSINNDMPNAFPSLRASVAFAYDNQAILSDSNGKRLIHLLCRHLPRSYAMVDKSRAKDIDETKKNIFKFDSWWRRWWCPITQPDDIGFAIRFGLIALGNLGDTDLDKNEEPVDAQLLCQVLRGCYAKGDTLGRCKTKDPSRGFAAIALGLYLKRLPRETSLIRNDKQKDIARYIERLLTRIAIDDEETDILRAACALALGLDGRNESNDKIKTIIKCSPPPLVASYAILALGMQRDPATFRLARIAFKKTADQIDVKQIQTAAKFQNEEIEKTQVQRVLVQSLACMSTIQANNMLYPYLTDNLYTSREIIRAFKWSGDHDVTALLAELLKKPGKKKVQTASFCAWALGELHDKKAYSVAHERMLLNRNFTLLPVERNTFTGPIKYIGPGNYRYSKKTQPYLHLTNLFLFEHVIKGPRN